MVLLRSHELDLPLALIRIARVRRTSCEAARPRRGRRTRYGRGAICRIVDDGDEAPVAEFGVESGRRGQTVAHAAGLPAGYVLGRYVAEAFVYEGADVLRESGVGAKDGVGVDARLELLSWVVVVHFVSAKSNWSRMNVLYSS